MEVTGPRSHSLLVADLGLEARPSDSQSTMVSSQTQRGASTSRLLGLSPGPSPAALLLLQPSPLVCEGLAKEEKTGLRWGFYLIL